MKFNIRRWPSGGFLLLVASHLLLVSVLVWGYSQPDLDRAWVILQDLHSEGFTGLSASDIHLLRRLLKRHPTLIRAILGNDSVGFVEPSDNGWTARSPANLVIQSSSGIRRSLVVECRAQPGAYPVTVSLESDTFRQSLQFSENGRQAFELVAEGPSYPTWAAVRIQTSARPGYAALPEIHVEVSSSATPKQYHD